MSLDSRASRERIKTAKRRVIWWRYTADPAPARRLWRARLHYTWYWAGRLPAPGRPPARSPARPSGQLPFAPPVPFRSPVRRSRRHWNVTVNLQGTWRPVRKKKDRLGSQRSGAAQDPLRPWLASNRRSLSNNRLGNCLIPRIINTVKRKN